MNDQSPIPTLHGRQWIRTGTIQNGDVLTYDGEILDALECGAVGEPVYNWSSQGYGVYRVIPVPKQGDNGMENDQAKAFDQKKHQSAAREAISLVLGDRNTSYGNPKDDYVGTAKVWSGLLAGKLKEDITAEEAILMMVGLKLRRETHKHKRDNIVDAHGYLLCLEWALDGEPPVV